MHENLDAEWRRLCGVYAAMGTQELMALDAQRGGLTRVAQQALDAALSQRRLVRPATAGPMPDGAEGVLLNGVRLDGGEPDGSGPGGGETDKGWISVLGTPLAIDIDKAAAVLDAHHLAVRVRADSRGTMYLCVEEAARAAAETLLRKETDLFALHEETDSAYQDREGAADELFGVGTFEVAADLEVAERALREAGIWFSAVKEAVEADADAGTPAGDATSVEVKFEEYERAVEVLDKAFAAQSA